jgi:para-aminobenzoate synthetase / 4-amino-4-deoxychorismate lyase
MTTHPRPDPALGLFETLLVLDGEPVELDAHLGRLAASLDGLYGSEPPAELAAAIGAGARGMALGRLRVTVGGDGALTELTTEEVDPADHFPAADAGAVLRSHPHPGGLGAHKLADRRALGETRGAVVPLLIEPDGEVLEAGRANVFVAVDGALLTPGADGRILPGIARAGAIAAAAAIGIEVTEARLDRQDLVGADEVFLTGSVRGVEPALTLDGERLPGAGELSRRVGEGLRRRWERPRAGAGAPALAIVPPPGPPAR